MCALPYETSCKGILGRPKNVRRALSFTRPNAVTGKKEKKKAILTSNNRLVFAL